MTTEEILELEKTSIRDFVLSCHESYCGRVLDFGCGSMPYRDIVVAHLDPDGEYVPHDRTFYPANVSSDDIGPDDPLRHGKSWDAILCNQVIHLWEDPAVMLSYLKKALKPGGALVMTGPTNWRTIEPGDLHRYTREGIRLVLENAHFEVRRCEYRASIEPAPGFEMPLGWGVVAYA